jgi:hypothetical protein
MPDGSADYRAFAPEVQPVQINPTIGIYQDGYGSAVSGLGRDVYGIANRLDSASEVDLDEMQDRQARFATAGYLMEDVDTHIDTTLDVSGMESGVQFTPEEREAIRAGQIDADKIFQGRSQLSSSTLLDLRRAANFRRQLAANPYLAPELDEAYRISGGRSIQQGLRDVMQDAEQERTAMREYYTKEALKLGVSPTADIGEMATAVIGHNRKLVNGALAEAEFKELQRNNAVNETNSKLLLNTVALAKMEEMRGIIAERVKAAQESGSELDRQALIQDISNFYSDTMAKTMSDPTYNAPGVSPTAVRDAFIPLKLFVDSSIETISGKRELDLVKTQFDLATQMAEYRLNSKIGFDVVAANKMLASSSPEMQAALQAVVDLSPMLSQGIASVVSEEQARRVRTEVTEESAEQARNYAEANRLYLVAQAKRDDITDREFNTILTNTFTGYTPGGNDAIFFHNAWRNITQPEVLARLGRGLDATTTATLSESLTKYMADLGTSTTNRIRTALAPFELGLPEAEVQPGSYPQPAGARRELTFNVDLSKYVETGYTENGMPRFQMKANVPTDRMSQVSQVVRDLNSVGTSIGDIVKVAKAMEMYPNYTPAELGEFIVKHGMLPGQAEAMARKQDEAMAERFNGRS